MTLRHSILLVPVAVLGLAACGGSESGDVPSNAVAVVTKCDAPVTKSDYNAILNQARTNYTQSKRPFPEPGTQEYQGVQNQIVGYLVMREGYICEGEKMGLEASGDDIDKGLNDLIKQYYQGDRDKYEQDLKKQHLSEDQVRKQVEMQVVQRKIFDKVTADVKVSDDDIRKYYNQNKEQYTNAATRSVRHILVKKRSLADELEQRLRNGADFAALARQYSVDPGSKKRGGKLDLAQGQTVPAFDKLAFKLKKGEISEPVHTQFGWHIIQALTPVKPANVQTLAQVRNSIREIIVQSKKSQKAQQWAEKFRTELQKPSAVRYQAGFQPPKQTSTTDRRTTGG